MTCMCGDLYCPSCGPAQGNSQCPVCGRWSYDQFFRCTGCSRTIDGEDRPDDDRCDRCGHLLEEDDCYGCYDPEACQREIDRQEANLAQDLEKE